MIVGGGRRARRQLRGQGLRHPHGDGRTPGAPPVPACDRRPAADVGLLGGEQGGLPRCSTTRRRSSKGCRSTRRSSTFAACERIRGHAAGDRACSCGATCAERVGLPITVGVARTKFLAKVASGVAKPDGLLVVPPDGELGLPPPAPGRAAVGRRAGHRRQAARARDHDRRPGRRRSAEAALVFMLGRRVGPAPPRARPQSGSAPGAKSADGAGSIGSQRALGRRTPRTRDAVDAVLIGLVDRVTRRMRTAGRVGRTVVLRLRFDDFSRATRSHTAAAGDRAHADHPRHGPLAPGGGDAADRAAGPHARRHRGRQPRGRPRGPARLAVRPSERDRPRRRRSTRCASGSARPRSPAPCCSAASCARRCRSSRPAEHQSGLGSRT